MIPTHPPLNSKPELLTAAEESGPTIREGTVNFHATSDNEAEPAVVKRKGRKEASKGAASVPDHVAVDTEALPRRLDQHAGLCLRREQGPLLRRPVVRPLRLGHRHDHPIPVADDPHLVQVHHDGDPLHGPHVEVGRLPSHETQQLEPPPPPPCLPEPPRRQRRAHHVGQRHPAPPRRLHERGVVQRQCGRRLQLVQGLNGVPGTAIDPVGDDGGVGDVDDDLVRLPSGAGHDERAPPLASAAGGRLRPCQHVGLVGLVEADVVEGQRLRCADVGGLDHATYGGDLGGGEGVEGVSRAQRKT